MNPDPVPDYLQLAVAWATVFGALGVIIAGIALWVQWLRGRRDRRDARAQAIVERERFEKQIEALQQSENDRLAAQARRIVPSFLQASAVIPNLWHVRIDNASTEVISSLYVDVYAVDHEDNKVPDACVPADRISLGQAMAEFLDRTMKPTFDMVNERWRDFVEQVKSGVIELGEDPAQFEAYLDQITAGMDINEQTAAAMKEQVKHEIAVNLSDQWPMIMSPGQFAARPFILARADLLPRVYLRFDEPFGYTWERTDITKPRRVHEPSDTKTVEVHGVAKKRVWWKPATWF